MRIVFDFLKFFFASCSVILLVMFVVNVASPEPTHDYNSARCTRYCHDHGCSSSHLNSIFVPIYKSMGFLYRWNIKVLKEQRFLGYKQINVIIYVVIWPFLMFIMTFIVIKQRKIIREIKKRRKLDV